MGVHQSRNNRREYDERKDQSLIDNCEIFLREMKSGESEDHRLNQDLTGGRDGAISEIRIHVSRREREIEKPDRGVSGNVKKERRNRITEAPV